MSSPVALWLCLLVLATAPAPAGAQEPADEGPALPAGDGSGLDLGDLLRPRGGFESKPAKREGQRGGRDEREWRDAFGRTRAEVTALEEKVAESQQKIRRVTGNGSYKFSPVGVGESVDPEVHRLRAQLKRDRQSLDTARSRLRDLEVEASLAGVPDSWRETSDVDPGLRPASTRGSPP